MLTIEELFECQSNPKINDISLKLLQEYYEYFLYPNIYLYDLEYDFNGQTINKKIKIQFDKDKFCHLLGIEKIVSKNFNFKKLLDFKGVKGWDNISNQDITIKKLKDINKSAFNSCKNKFVFFYLIPKILSNPIIVKYDRNRVDPETFIESKFIFYDKELNACVHVGIDIGDDNIYYPRSFFIEKINKDNLGDKFIKEQTDVFIKEFDIIKKEN